MKKFIVSLIVLMCYASACFAGTTLTVKSTGYFPSGYKSKKQARMEGGSRDRYGNVLKTLQEYKEGEYVSCATDPRIIKSGTLFKIKELPNITFLACDVGRAIKGHRVDICVKSEKHSYQLPKKVTIEKTGVIYDIKRASNRQFKLDMFGVRFTEVWRRAYIYILSQLERRENMAKDFARRDMARKDRISLDSADISKSVRFRQASISRFCTARYYSN